MDSESEDLRLSPDSAKSQASWHWASQVSSLSLHYPCKMGAITADFSASQKYCAARRRDVPMRALRETHCALQTPRGQGGCTNSQGSISVQDPSLPPPCIPSTLTFPSSHIPEFRETVHHPHLKNANSKRGKRAACKPSQLLALTSLFSLRKSQTMECGSVG